jgi:ferredoxin/flavodoxin---NADP+ reductase
MPKAVENKPPANTLFPVKVTCNEEISPGVFLLTWRQKVVFIPGQVVKVAFDHYQPPRIYSLCCRNTEENISILFNIKEEGYLTPLLAASVPGDELLVSNPYGSFHGDHSPAFWIATGTGIAPFYSMFQAGFYDHKILIHGARYLSQFYFQEELEWAMGNNYIRCSSSEKSDYVFAGRITDYLLAANHFPKDYKYYLCGKSLMVVGIRDLLISKGIPYTNIFAEIYF